VRKRDNSRYYDQSDIKRIALLVTYNAREAGRTTPNMADIDAALNDVLPTAEHGLFVHPGAPKTTLKRSRKAVAKPLPSPRNRINTLPIPNRETRPLLVGG
jgi:hypothetical protein